MLFDKKHCFFFFVRLWYKVEVIYVLIEDEVVELKRQIKILSELEKDTAP